MASWPPPALALGAALAMTTLVWVASLVKRDASNLSPRAYLAVGLVTLWGLRLSFYILWRNWGRGEDYRYREMRERNPATFPVRSLLTVFWLQAVLLWAISAPLYQAQRRPDPVSLTPLDILGLALFLVALAFEAGGDSQLARFKRDPGNKGKVMNRGLWRYTRHPNYFGDSRGGSSRPSRPTASTRSGRTHSSPGSPRPAPRTPDPGVSPAAASYRSA